MCFNGPILYILSFIIKGTYFYFVKVKTFEARDCTSYSTRERNRIHKEQQNLFSSKLSSCTVMCAYICLYPVMICLLYRSPDLIIEVAHPCVTTEHGAYFLQHADYMVCTVYVCGTDLIQNRKHFTNSSQTY